LILRESIGNECQRTEINGESTSMVWPTLRLRMAKEQKRAVYFVHHGK